MSPLSKNSEIPIPLKSQNTSNQIYNNRENAYTPRSDASDITGITTFSGLNGASNRYHNQKNV